MKDKTESKVSKPTTKKEEVKKTQPKSKMDIAKLKATIVVLHSMVKNHENLNDTIKQNVKDCIKMLG